MRTSARRGRFPRRPSTSRSVQRRTVGVLSGGVALGGLGVTVGITVGGLLARDVAGTDSASGLGQTAGVLGAAVIAVPLARISDRAGRRAGLAVGLRRRRPRRRARGGRRGAVLAAAAAASGLFAFGAATACGLQARYAAADLAPPERRGRACRSSSGRRRSARCSAPTSPARAPTSGRRLGLPRPRRRLRGLGRGVRASWPLGLLVLLRPDPLLLARRLGGGGRRPRGRAGPPARRVRAVWAHAGRPARADRRRGLPLGDGRRHGHDAGAHGARRRRRGDDAAPHRPGHQRARRRHVPVLPAGRHAGRPRRPDRRPSRWAGVLLLAAAAAGRDGAARSGRAAGRGPLPARAGLVVRPDRGLDAGDRVGGRGRAADRPGRRPTCSWGSARRWPAWSVAPCSPSAGFGLVTAVSAALVLPLAVVWATCQDGGQRPR